jgi:tetratricopeptide (TPR) repeat protein
LPFQPSGEYDALVRLAAAITVLILIVGGSSAQTRPADVQSLIDQLAEPDPVVRKQAAEQIISLGSDARPGLLQATESDNPEIRSRAGELLQQLPWFRQNDPDEVKKILESYGTSEEAKRFISMRQLADLPNGAGIDALMRLIDEETNHRLRWLAVGAIRDTSTFGANKARLRAFNTTDATSPIVLLAGWGWMHVDMNRCLALFDQAAEMESRDSRHPNVEISYALSVLAENAVAHDEYANAADFVRRKIHFMDADEDPADDPRLELFSLHARYGPLDGFAIDYREYASELRPRSREFLYTFAGLMRRWSLPAGETLAVYLRSAATPPPEARMPVADFLVARDWNEWGMAEYQAIRDTDNLDDFERVDMTALERMARVSSAEKNDADAAGYFEELLQALSQSDAVLMNRGDRGEHLLNYVESLIQWHRLRAAQAKSDADGIDKSLAELVKLSPTDTDIVIDVVPLLKQKNREKEAAALFDPAYDKIKAMLDKEPDNPEHVNNLAWLCARCDERLDEALELSSRAIEEMPQNFAYLDTAAEANFRKGNPAKAVELEEFALTFRPKDTFMIEQLERFRKGN